MAKGHGRQRRARRVAPVRCEEPSVSRGSSGGDPYSPWQWILEVTDIKGRGIYGKPENTRMLGIPPEWGDFRAMDETQRVREWLRHERSRQAAERERLRAEQGQEPDGGWTNAIGRCEWVLGLLDAVACGEKVVRLYPLDEYARAVLAESTPVGRLVAEMERLLASLDRRPGVRVGRREPLSLGPREVGVPARRPGTVYHDVCLAPDADDVAHDEAEALQRLDSLLDLLERRETGPAIVVALEAGRLIERISVRPYESRALRGKQAKGGSDKGTAATKQRGERTKRRARDEYEARRNLRPFVPSSDIVDDVARALRMSARTVYRHLPEEVRDEIDGVAKEAAERRARDKA